MAEIDGPSIDDGKDTKIMVSSNILTDEPSFVKARSHPPSAKEP